MVVPASVRAAWLAKSLAIYRLLLHGHRTEDMFPDDY